MTKVIGIRFRKAGKVYYFSPGENEIKTGDHVIVETARGVEYGYVVLGTHEVDDKKVIQPLKCVIRMATPADEETERQMYHHTREILGAYGYRRYEISNYAKEGYECRHNLGYWNRTEYLGIGTGAASLIGNRRWSEGEEPEH